MFNFYQCRKCNLQVDPEYCIASRSTCPSCGHQPFWSKHWWDQKPRWMYRAGFRPSKAIVQMWKRQARARIRLLMRDEDPVIPSMKRLTDNHYTAWY